MGATALLKRTFSRQPRSSVPLVVPPIIEQTQVSMIAEFDWKAFHKRNSLTPDIWKLEQFKRHLIFLPDDLQSGGRFHEELIKDFSYTKEPLNPDCYTNASYTMWIKQLGKHSFPIILPSSYRPTGFVRYPVIPAKIKGELWEIVPDAFKELDNLRDNGTMFARQQIKVMYPWREVRASDLKPLPNIGKDQFVTVPAWFYLGIQSYWDGQIGGIFADSQPDLYEHDDPKPWIGQYYKFVVNS